MYTEKSANTEGKEQDSTYTMHTFPPENIAIPMDDIKARLAKLEEHLQWEPSVVYIFAEYLSKRMGPRLTPTGFALSYKLALDDVISGTDSKGPVPECLMNHKMEVYNYIRSRIPWVAAAVCPEEYAGLVKKVYDTYIGPQMELK